MEERDFSPEFEFITSRSGGAGGQNVNKVSSKVMLCFKVRDSALLSLSEKDLLIEKLANKINLEGTLQIVSQKERTQLGNKELCIKKFYILLEKALYVPKRRRKTRPTFSSVEKRLESKKKLSEQKQKRKKIDDQ
jgi:ribosome-associated protein